MPTTKSEKSWYANIWMAGDYHTAVQTLRKYVNGVGLCVTVSPCAYVYTGGMEDGVLVRMIQYPRFPTEEGKLKEKAEWLAMYLRTELAQDSYTIEFPDETIWFSTRE